MHYSGVKFESTLICMQKMMRNGSETCCGMQPTAQEKFGGFLHKCEAHFEHRASKPPDLKEKVAYFRPPTLNGEVMPSNYDREIKMFIDAMRYKLERNASRGKWEKTTLLEALNKCRGELDELEDAASRKSAVEILLEAADVANYAMIAAHIAMQEALDVRA